MAQHSTHKSTTDGKRLTTARRARRRHKYAAPGLDLDRLTADLHREQAAMERANQNADRRYR